VNRFHVHLNVADLAASIRFYSELFATEPTVLKPDYAKWMLEDPRVNFAVSTTCRAPGIDHLGLQVDSAAELAALGRRLHAAGGTVVAEKATTCCYARSDKNWIEDPQGTRWETFHTFGDATKYHDSAVACAAAATAACEPNLSAKKSHIGKQTSGCSSDSSCC
jgi:predicted enzyme related to lactoylglutathione lyase